MSQDAPSQTTATVAAGTPRSAITVGTFDGIHAGHAALARRTVEHAHRLSATPRALIFDPHPLTVLRPDLAPPRLSTFDQRTRWLRDLGIDTVHRLDPASGILGLTATEFVEHTSREHHVAAWVEGPDFRFGKARAGDNALLTQLAPSLGFTTDIVEPVGVSLDNHHIARASSTLVRTLLAEGRVRDAARVLGRPYELAGTIVRGERRGRTINYPTANIDTDQLLPADGVYAGWATIHHQSTAHTLRAAISIGTKPTFGDKPRTAEAFLLDAPKDQDSPAIAGMPEYGFAIRLTFARHIRDQMRFDTLDQLIAQMDRDITRTRTLLPDVPAPSPANAKEHHATNT